MKPLLIGLVGRAGSGKDTAAKLLREATLREGYPWKLLSFADPLKRICKEVFDFSEDQLWGPSSERNKPDLRYPRANGTCLTPREALQTLGTQWGRECYPDIWSEYGIRRARALLKHECNIIFTDVRFVNEAKAIRGAGGWVWRIYRPEADSVEASHQSEMELESAAMKALVTNEIFNTEGLEKLKAEVLAALAVCRKQT